MKSYAKLPRIPHVGVHTPQGDAGTLANEHGTHAFTYLPDASASRQVSLLMPPRLAPYTGGVLPPVFSMNLPEGFLLEQFRVCLEAIARINPLLLLALPGDAHPIGRLAASSAALEQLLPGRSMPRSARAGAAGAVGTVLLPVATYAEQDVRCRRHSAADRRQLSGADFPPPESSSVRPARRRRRRCAGR